MRDAHRRIAHLFNVVIGCEFFFAGPGVEGGLIAVCLAMAVIGLYRAEPALGTERLVNA